MGYQVQNNQLHFGVTMVRQILLFLGQDGMGMGNDFPIFQFMRVEKQNPVGQNGQHQSQTEMAKKGQYVPEKSQFEN